MFQAILSPRAIRKLEQEFYKRGNSASLNLALPLTVIPCPETSKLCDEFSGFLNIRLTYSSYFETETLPKYLEFGSTQSLFTTKSQASQTDSSTPKHAVRFISTQTSLQLIDFIPESDESDQDCQIITPSNSPTQLQMIRKSVNVISTQTSLQLIDFLPESQAQDEECQILPSLEGEQTSPDKDSGQNSDFRTEELPEDMNDIVSEEIIPDIPIIQTERKNIASEINDGTLYPENTCQVSNHIPSGQNRLFTDSTNLSHPRPQGPMFRARVEVERAANLPVLEDGWYNTLVAPSTYMTMPADQPGMIVASPLVVKSCNPVYDWHCDIYLPVHLLMPVILIYYSF